MLTQTSSGALLFMIVSLVFVRVYKCICSCCLKRRVYLPVSQHTMIYFSSDPESDPGFPGCREHWHQTVPGELSRQRPHTHFDNTEGPFD